VRTEPERCSVRSTAFGESIAGTASTVATWILLEHPGPWGRDALTASRLPAGLGRELRALANSLRTRIVLIRRYGRRDAGAAVVCFFAHTGPDRSWLQHARLGGPGELLGADLSSLRRGDPPGVGEPDAGPLFVTCTHGRRDPCCAERGRPVARALDGSHGDRAWEVSHIGGDRFAGNLICFPHGLYFGRLDPESAVRVARGYERGEIDLERYRGRSCYAFAVQAAETHVRLQSGATGVDDLRPVRTLRPESDVIEASFATSDGAVHTAAVRTRLAEEPRVLTCHGLRPERPPTYEIVGYRVDPVS
jgi:hypothetical protein